MIILEPFRQVAPYLITIFDRLAREDPKLIETRAVTDCLFGLYCLNPRAFMNGKRNVPSLTIPEIRMFLLRAQDLAYPCCHIRERSVKGGTARVPEMRYQQVWPLMESAFRQVMVCPEPQEFGIDLLHGLMVSASAPGPSVKALAKAAALILKTANEFS